MKTTKSKHTANKKAVAVGLLGMSIAFTSVIAPTGNVLHPLQSVQVQAAETITFKDLGKGSFAYSAVQSLAAKKVTAGYPDGTFKPEQKVTRGQFAAMLARALDLPKADSSFKDLNKKMALYDSVSRAAKAGIIQGDNGYVKSNDPVTRADIAVMVDRAMQMKGTYEKTGSLSFADKSEIPAYALASVEKMTSYQIIQGKGNNSFAPAEVADRATSAVFIWRMLNVLDGKQADGKTSPVPSDKEETVKSPSEKHYTELTLAEMKERVGEFVLVDRIRIGGKEEIRTLDYVEGYYEDLHESMRDSGGVIPAPELFFTNWVEGLKGGFSGVIASSYPVDRELISFNGVAYRDSELYTPSDTTADLVLPRQPKEAGKFLIDIQSASAYFVTYTKELVKPDHLVAKPTPNGEMSYMVNMEKVFANAPGVTIAKDGSALRYGLNKVMLEKGSKTMTVNGKEKTMTAAAVLKDGSYYADIREVAEALGLEGRQVGGLMESRFEVANYPLAKTGGPWR